MKEVCENSKQKLSDHSEDTLGMVESKNHLVELNGMVSIGSGAERQIQE